MAKSQDQLIHVRLRPGILTSLDAYAERLGQSRNAAVNALLAKALHREIAEWNDLVTRKDG